MFKVDIIEIRIGGFYMKSFFKVFIVSFLIFFLALYAGAATYLKKKNLNVGENLSFGFYEDEDIAKSLLNKLETKPIESKTYKSLKEAVEDNSRLNLLVLGIEDIRTDTILLASFNKDSKDLDVISIPRDTYVHRKGYNSGDQRKINSVYYNHDVEGVMKTVSYILSDIPIHHYLIIDYEGVKSIVDAVGGVEVDVPFDMKYEDISANPPVNIDIKKGVQVLDGKNALDFIRWRKANNKTGYIDGDLGRINTQQRFLTSLAGKIKENILPLITRTFKYVDTDMKLVDVLSNARNAIGIEDENINFRTLPGKSDMRLINGKLNSYYVHDQIGVKELVEEIYNVEKEE
ncbi:LytR family transcriptional regulator [Tissierella creatinini]|nr:LytR family transcriptional regulator [Tissierella creatinini]TJX62396.1 LytR family transcriptional regulator [Soehngenia saccharolytica]